MSILTISIYYCCSADKVWAREINLPVGSTIKDALEASGLISIFPDPGLLEKNKMIGIFGKKKKLDSKLSHGDRIELYRSLWSNPVESRRNRAGFSKKRT